MAPVILISGLNRTGTSLLQRLLDGHPSLYVYSDEFIFCEDRCRWPDLEDGIRSRNFCDLYDNCKNAIFLKYWLDMSLLRKTEPVRNSAPFTLDFSKWLKDWQMLLDEHGEWSENIILTTLLKSFFDNLEEHTRRPNCINYVIKKPRLGFDYKKYFSIFPNGKLLLLEREFYDFLASEIQRCGYHELGWNDSFGFKLRTILNGWLDGRAGEELRAFFFKGRKKLFVEAMARDYKLYKELLDEVRSNANVLIVKYENLVSDLESEMKRVATFLEIEFNNKLLRPTVYGKAWRSNTSFESIENMGDMKGNINARYWNANDKKIIHCIYREAEPSSLDEALRKKISPWPLNVFKSI